LPLRLEGHSRTLAQSKLAALTSKKSGGALARPARWRNSFTDETGASSRDALDGE
jgi:hypothetical protein